MDTAAPTGESRRGLRRWQKALAAALPGIPLLVFALSNLWLASPLGRAWTAGKLTAATGLDATVAGASWSPWGGASLRGVRISQPAPLDELVGEPLAEIGTIHLTPVWSAWLRGRPAIREINLESPRIVLPVQVLAHFLEQAAQPPAMAMAAADPLPGTEPPPLAGPAGPAEQPPTGRPSDDPAEPAAGPVTPGDPSGPAAIPPFIAAADPAGPPAAEAAATPPVPDAAPPTPPATSADAAARSGTPEATGWVRVSDGAFKLVFAGLAIPLLDLAGLDAAIPVGGGPASPDLRLGTLAVLGQTVLDGLELPLRREGPVLNIGPLETEQAGVLVRVAARLAFTQGLPLELEILLPPQSPEAPVIIGHYAVHPAKLEAALRFHGLLLAPGGWRGEALAGANDISIRRSDHAAQDTARQTGFSRGGGIVIMSGGVLSCLDARLIGDHLSFLGNGTRLPDGRTAAVLRVVANPDLAANFHRRVFPALEEVPALTPLSTPERAALDFELLGSAGGMMLRLGRNGPLVDLPELLADHTPSP
jgi:hypothetical protein